MKFKKITDCGDNNYNVAFFNHANSFNIAEGATKHRYVYTGPVTRNGILIKFVNNPIETIAQSMKQAESNFKYRIKQSLPHIPANAIIELEGNIIEIPEDTEPQEHICDVCGQLLNDSGQCPLCDLGDESVLED